MATLEDLKASLSRNSKIKEVFESEEYAYSRVVFKKRMKLGLSQTELAKKAGVTQKTISRVEGADSSIRPQTLRKVSRALKLDETEDSFSKKHEDVY